MTESSEILGRVVGMLTARRDESMSYEEIVDLFTSLLTDLDRQESFSLPLRIDDPPEVVQEAVQGLVDEVVRKAGASFAAFVAAFIYAFEELAAEYEAACTDADVPGLLRRIALQSTEADE